MGIGNENALQRVAALDCGDHKFNQLMKYSLINFTINSMRITPIPTNDKRTIFVEYIVPIVKYFSNITALMSFLWCERKDKESASSIFFVTQVKSPTTLLNRIGINDLMMLVEKIVNPSSHRLKVTTDINHLLEDSMKNFRSATNALKSIMCRFPNASMNTVKLANVYSIQIIQTKMTLIKYSLKDKDTFKAIECSS
ncbi:uncharacterized protein EV154DRAFT_580926, partial [Mucor mucedo]|uniref:uncharacterized protein n=1 Tax=Mucor mucedo TaxID=29922 RepID=UPI002220DF8C